MPWPEPETTGQNGPKLTHHAAQSTDPLAGQGVGMTIDEYDSFVRSNLTLFHKHIQRLQLAGDMKVSESRSIPGWSECFSEFVFKDLVLCDELKHQHLTKADEGC